MAITGNVLFFSRNYADAATVTPDAAPPAAHPAANLTTEPPRDTWRSPNLASTGLLFDIGADIPLINALCVIRHNLTVNATFSLYAHASAGIFPATPGPASFKLENQDVFPSFFGVGEFYCGFGGAGGVLDDGDLPLYHATRFLTFEQQEFRYWYFKITDAGNPNSYIEMGRLFLGWAFQPELNFDWNHELELVDKSKIIETRGGGVLVNIETPYREKTVKLNWLSDSEKYMDVYNMAKTIGKRGNLVIAFFPDMDGTAIFFETIYGKFTKFSGIRQTFADNNQFDFVFRELI